MKLVIENARLGETSAKSVEGKIEYSAEVLYIGGRAFVKNPKRLPSGDYASVSISVDIKNEADQWQTKDKLRSGAMIVSSLRFGEIVEVAKK